MAEKLFFPHYPDAGPLYPVLLASFFYTYCTAFYWLYLAYRSSAVDRQKRMQCLVTLVGVGLAWANVATLFLLIYDVSFTPQMVLFPIMFFAPVYSIIRYRFLDIRVVVTRAGLLLCVYLVVLGLPFLIGWTGRGWLEGRFPEVWWLIPLGLSTALATAGPFAYAYLRRQAEERLLREQRRYQRVLQRAARGMTQVRNIHRLSNLITRVVSGSVRLTHASLFLWDKTRQRYGLLASHGQKRLATQSRYALQPDHPLIAWLMRQRRSLTLEQAQALPEKAVAQEMINLGVGLIIPGLIERQLIGFLVLGPKLSGEGFSVDDLHAFTMLAHESAMALENAASYEELIKANEQLKAASERLLFQERLAAAGQFAMGMAHEVKNPLSAIKTFAQYLPEKYADADFREKFFRIVQSEIDRINTIVRELSDFAKPSPLQLKPVQLTEIIEDTVTLLSNQCLKQGVEVHIDLRANGVAIQADEGQLKQVLLNVLLNSIEAMPAGGLLSIETDADAENLVLKVKDTGDGIPLERQKQIWDPFFTTKERGMGLGLAIVRGTIERHGGQIRLFSAAGKGTTMEFCLPINASAPT